MKCQYIYDAIDHYSYSNQINKKKKEERTIERLTNMLDCYFETSCQNSFSYSKKSQINKTIYVLLLTKGLMMGTYIYIKKRVYTVRINT